MQVDPTSVRLSRSFFCDHLYSCDSRDCFVCFVAGVLVSCRYGSHRNRTHHSNHRGGVDDGCRCNDPGVQQNDGYTRLLDNWDSMGTIGNGTRKIATCPVATVARRIAVLLTFTDRWMQAYL